MRITTAKSDGISPYAMCNGSVARPHINLESIIKKGDKIKIAHRPETSTFRVLHIDSNTKELWVATSTTYTPDVTKRLAYKNQDKIQRITSWIKGSEYGHEALILDSYHRNLERELW